MNDDGRLTELINDCNQNKRLKSLNYKTPSIPYLKKQRKRNNMEIKIVKDSINKKELIDIAREQFGSLIKAVVDIGQGIMAVGGEMHADEEAVLMEQENSRREDVWGINVYPEKSGKELIEFDSIINIKPSYGNCSRGVEDLEIKEKIKMLVKKLITE